MISQEHERYPDDVVLNVLFCTISYEFFYDSAEFYLQIIPHSYLNPRNIIFIGCPVFCITCITFHINSSNLLYGQPTFESIMYHGIAAI